MFRLVLVVAMLSARAAHAQDTDSDTDGETEESTDGDNAAALAGEEGGSSCAVAGQAGLGLFALASILAATRVRAR